MLGHMLPSCCSRNISAYICLKMRGNYWTDVIPSVKIVSDLFFWRKFLHFALDMMDDDSELTDGLLGNLAASGAIENVVHLPAELLVLSNETSDPLDPTKSLNLSPQTLLNVGGNYLVTSLKNNSINNNSSLGKHMSLDCEKNGSVAFLDPPPKKQKSDEDALKKMLLSVQHSILERLESIEKKVEKITTKCQCLEEKVENMILTQNVCALNGDPSGKGSRFSDLPNGFPMETAGEGGFYSPLSSLNNEASYPNGSWLGNPENEAFRVRCSISPKDLVSINETCNTPVKMALTLLDYLFDRETQACSNISGAGKHGKLQLDPVKIFGIRCHLMYMFGVTELQWRRIKLNLDSKCRSAFRRKQKGMPLTVKGFREKSSSDNPDAPKNLEIEDPNANNALAILNELGAQQQQQAQSTILQITEPETPSDVVNIISPEDPANMEFSDVIHTDHGDIHVIHATLEQLAQLKDNTQVEILSVAPTASQT